MGDLIKVFEMDIIPVETRINVLIKLSNAIDNTYCMNITGPLVYELVKILNPESDELERLSEFK